jgi:hypothetical protein
MIHFCADKFVAQLKTFDPFQRDGECRTSVEGMEHGLDPCGRKATPREYRVMPTGNEDRLEHMNRRLANETTAAKRRAILPR